MGRHFKLFDIFYIALAHAENLCTRASCVSACVCVCEGVGWGGMQVNSLRGPTAPRASLAHHLTAIPDEGLRTNELIKQMSEQASVGVDRWRRLTQGGGAVAQAEPAHISHQRLSSRTRRLLSCQGSTPQRAHRVLVLSNTSPTSPRCSLASV